MELTTSIADFVKNALILWAKGYDSVPQTMRKSGLYQIVPIAKNSGNTREFSEIDGEEYAKRKDEGDDAQRAQVQQGYTKIMTKYRVALDIGITYEMRTENKYPEIVSTLTGLGRQVAQRLDLDLAHPITFGTATSYVDMDGTTVDITTGDELQLFYTAHTLKGSSTTYRNRLANNPRLSKGALEGMERLAVEETYNQFGQKMTMSFDVLWTTDDPNTINTAREYLQSTADVEGAHSGIKNVYMSKYKHVILPRVATDNEGNPDSDKRYYWGIANTAKTGGRLGVWEEPRLKTPPTDGNSGEEFASDNYNFGARGGYGIVWTNGTSIKMSSGDGTA